MDIPIVRPQKIEASPQFNHRRSANGQTYKRYIKEFTLEKKRNGHGVFRSFLVTRRKICRKRSMAILPKILNSEIRPLLPKDQPRGTPRQVVKRGAIRPQGGAPGKGTAVKSENVLTYFDLTLSMREVDQTVRTVDLRFLESNLYLVAFHPGDLKDDNGDDLWYEFSQWREEKHQQIIDLKMTKLNPEISVNYKDFGDRTEVKLGKHELEKAIRELSLYRNGKNGKDNSEGIRPHVLTIIQMFSEALRFPDIRERIGSFYDLGGYLTRDLVAMENNWGKYSRDYIAGLVREAKEWNYIMPRPHTVAVAPEHSGFNYELYDTGSVNVVVKHTDHSIDNMKKYAGESFYFYSEDL